MATTTTTTPATVLVAALMMALLGAVRGHMIMNTPTPYNYRGTAKLLQVDPLGETLPFPCQGMTDVVSVTPVTAGATQVVKFTGGAQHGGGSCQFALTYEFPPPADRRKWKTIYTIIGGCPVSAAGNLPVTGRDGDGRADAAQCGDDAGTECIRQFDVPVPRGVPNGNATFAWTWFNKIGNREMYMNCAPVAISGGSDGDTAFLDALPPLFVANLPGECTTGNGVLNVPNPGRFGRVLEQPAADSEGNCPRADGVPVFDGGDGGGENNRNSSVVAPGPSSPASSPTSSSIAPPPGRSPSPSPSASTSQPALECPAATPTTTPAGAPSGAVPAPDPSATPGSGTASGRACSPDGAVVCFSPTTFGLCAHGVAVPQPVAAGTTCNGGKILRRSAKFAFW